MSVWGACVMLSALLLVVRAAPDPTALKHEEVLPSLATRVSSHVAPRLQEPRLPLPTPQELEAIKKVAQILVMLGEQSNPKHKSKASQFEADAKETSIKLLDILLSPHVIPAIIGEQPQGCCDIMAESEPGRDNTDA